MTDSIRKFRKIRLYKLIRGFVLFFSLLAILLGVFTIRNFYKNFTKGGGYHYTESSLLSLCEKNKNLTEMMACKMNELHYWESIKHNGWYVFFIGILIPVVFYGMKYSYEYIRPLDSQKISKQKIYKLIRVYVFLFSFIAIGVGAYIYSASTDSSYRAHTRELCNELFENNDEAEAYCALEMLQIKIKKTTSGFNIMLIGVVIPVFFYFFRWCYKYLFPVTNRDPVN